MFFLFLIIIACYSLLEACESQQQTIEIGELAKQTLEQWDIPGLALTVVHNGQDIHVAGYGVKERGKSESVNHETLFQIASLTKAFTSLTAAILVEEGKLSWDQPIHCYLPYLQFKDSIATEQITLIDLLSHQTGLPGLAGGEGNLWYRLNRSSEDLINRLAFVEPLYPIRSHFTYSNIAYVVASQVIAQVALVPWAQFCKERIFEPLQMTRSTISHELLVNDENVARPHLPSRIKVESISHLDWDSMGAAGGINSCAKDMAYWLKHCLSIYQTHSKIFEPHALVIGREIVGDEELPIWSIYTHDQEVVHYGFGWMMYQLNNKAVFFHLGLSDGMASMIALVPEEDLGIVVLTNQSNHLGDISLLNQLLDRFLGLTEVDWHRKSHQSRKNIDHLIQRKDV